MAREEIIMAKAKTHPVPLLTFAGGAYGMVVQPLFGGGAGATKGQPGAIEIGQAQGFAEGAKRYGQNFVGNYTGYSWLDGRWHDKPFDAMTNGWGMLILGAVGDKVTKVVKVQKFANKFFKFMGLKLRWTSPW
jgi:hypothetical protein